jgi:hypothetical protein
MNMRQAKRKHYAALKPWLRDSLWLNQPFYLYEYDDYDDDFTCDRCHGDGRDPWTDYLLPCPACRGEQH